MYKSHKELLSKEQFGKIEEEIMGRNFPWFYNDAIVYDGDGKYQFVHMMYLEGKQNSEYFPIIIPIIEKLDCWILLSAKINSLGRTESIVENSMHIDLMNKSYLNTNPFKTAIFYLNNNNGYTKFETGEKVTSEKNKLIVFDGNKRHTGTSNSCEAKRRVILNINYIPLVWSA